MNERFARASAIAQVELAHEPEFAFGGIRIRPAHCEIVGAGWSETLEPRVMQVLVALARANGEVVSRDDLIEACWEGRIVGEDSIGRCIGRLRKVAEASGNRFSIETVSRVGYRLKIADVAVSAPDANGSATLQADSIAADVAVSPSQPQASSPVRPPRSAAAVAAAVLVLFVTGFGFWWFWPRPAVAPVESAASVAVLPFVNLSGDPAKEYFSDGFSEELLNDLSSDSRLRVAARTSAFAFKGKNVDTQAIARTLHVHAIVVGSVREAGDRVRITAQLIDTGNGYNIWSATYDRNIADILSVQDDVSGAIALALTHRLAPGPTLSRPKIDPAIYRLYLDGRAELARLLPDGDDKAFAAFERVTSKQPYFAPGFAALAHAALYLISDDSDPARKASDLLLVNGAARRALSLDPHNLEARVQLEASDLYAWNWGAAASEVHRLRTESPEDLRVLASLRIYYTYMGFPDQALTVWRHALSIYPSTDLERLQLLSYLVRPDYYEEAIAVARTIVAHQPNQTWTMEVLCHAYAGTGRIKEARDIEERLRRLKPKWGPFQLSLDNCEFEIDLETGDLADARNIARTWEAEFPDRLTSATDIAEEYVLLDDFDKASDWYERAYQRREFIFFQDVYLSWGNFEKYHALSPRWHALAQQPLFKDWQAEHNKIAAELAARGGAP